jgi:hypothetical protein
MNRTASTKTVFSKRNKRPSTYRRVVTANVHGKSILRSDEQLQAYEFKSVPDYEHTLIWINPEIPDLREEQRFDHYPDSGSGTWRHKSSLRDVSAGFGSCGPIV